MKIDAFEAVVGLLAALAVASFACFPFLII
jgi:hypothetical protein